MFALVSHLTFRPSLPTAPPSRSQHRRWRPCVMPFITYTRRRNSLILLIRSWDQLDFHPLSVTLLGTVAYHNNWDNDRLAKEREIRRTRILRTDHNESHAATAELSFALPVFCKLGPDACEGLTNLVASSLKVSTRTNSTGSFTPSDPTR